MEVGIWWVGWVVRGILILAVMFECSKLFGLGVLILIWKVWVVGLV